MDYFDFLRDKEQLGGDHGFDAQDGRDFGDWRVTAIKIEPSND
jgi:hypothetical protein